MLWLLSGPPGFTCWISFFSGIQLYLLSSHLLCFIYFLYLDIHVLGDDAFISKGFFSANQPSMCLDPHLN